MMGSVMVFQNISFYNTKRFYTRRVFWGAFIDKLLCKPLNFFFFCFDDCFQLSVLKVQYCSSVAFAIK
jgi:hypothetical protein